jgi:hypothetical protein
MNTKFKIYAILLLLAFALIMPVSCLRVDGSLLETEAAPGEHIRHVMTVRLSEGEQSVFAEAKVMGYGINKEGGIDPVEKEDDNNPYSASGYFKVSPESFQLEPGVPTEVVLEGDVPSDIQPGGRYALVEIHTAPQGNGTIGFATAIIVPIRLTINGTNLIKTGEIVESDISGDDVLSWSFKNTGNLHFIVSAEAILKDDEGKVIGNFSSQKVVAVPESVYPFKISLNPDNNLTPGTYTVELSAIGEDGILLDSSEKTFEV